MVNICVYDYVYINIHKLGKSQCFPLFSRVFFRPDYILQRGPLPFISRMITPLIGVIIPATHLQGHLQTVGVITPCVTDRRPPCVCAWNTKQAVLCGCLVKQPSHKGRFGNIQHMETTTLNGWPSGSRCTLKKWLFYTKSKQSFLWRVHDWQCVLRWGPPGGQFYSASPPTFQCKPNHDLVVGFDDAIPYDRTFRNGEHLSGRTIPAPRWDEEPILTALRLPTMVRRDNSDHLMLHLRTWLLHRTDLYPRCREIIAWELNMLNRRYVYCILTMSSASTRYDLHQPLNQVDSLDCIWSWKETDRQAARPDQSCGWQLMVQNPTSTGVLLLLVQPSTCSLLRTEWCAATWFPRSDTTSTKVGKCTIPYI